MAPTFSRIGLTGKPGDEAVRAVLARLAGLAQRRGVEAFVDAGVRAGIDAPELPAAQLAASVDLIVCVGGDGSLMHAARQYGLAGLPLLGVNLGRLGFLVDVSPAELEQRVDELLAGRFIEERRLLLDMVTHRGDLEVARGVALNDVVLHKADPGRMQEFETRIDGVGVTTHRADGVMVATPTGSTAYALSAGGPILHPSLDALVLIPICPHTLSDRPLVVGTASRIALTVGSGTGGARVSCDGQRGFTLESGDTVTIVRNASSVRLLHPPDYDYFRILRDKLHWGRAPGPSE